jgi:ribosomal protein S30
MKSLMVAEKMRTQMPKAQIKELSALVERIKANPNYELTYEDVMIVDSTAPFINDDPYAFSDVLGTLIGPVLQAPSESIGISPSTEQILINAAKTITGLTQEQMDNLQNIGETYQNSQQFSSTPTNVSDVNQVIETSYYPDSANLLLPFLGAGTLIAMSQIHYGYPTYFYGEGINEYDRTVVRNPNVVAYNRAGVYPRYNNNWSYNRSQALENNSANRSQAWENNSNNRSQARENGVNDRTQTRDTRAGDRSGGGGRR